MKTMTIIAYKIRRQIPDGDAIEWDDFLKLVEPVLQGAKDIQKPLPNTWHIALADGLRILPSFHKIAQSRGVSLCALVSDEAVLSAL
jgi:hypothetical protein